MTELALSRKVSEWVAATSFDDLPDDVVAATRLRVMDVIGLSIAGGQRPFGTSMKAIAAMYPGTSGQLWGRKATASALGAAFINGAQSQALEFDDTHNESIVHMSSPAVASALALAEDLGASGRDVIRAVAIGNEISCRVGSIAPSEFHRRGFHPSGLFTPFGIAWQASAMLGLSQEQMIRAGGIVGSFAAGLIQCWVDGTQSKFLHPGWAAMSGIAAARMAEAGITGPTEVLEGRFGLFASHMQNADKEPNWGRLTDGLGSEWESRNASFKPYPVAHVSHPYITAILRLREQHSLTPAMVKKITVPVAPYIVGIVCEPLSEKLHPNTDSHGRVSLQYTLAEALALGHMGKDAYAESSLRDPEILGLTSRVEYVVDDTLPGPEQFKGIVRLELQDGTMLEEIEPYNRGSRENPMSEAEIVGKYRENVNGTLSDSEADRLAEAVLKLDTLGKASDLTALTVPANG